MVPQPRDKIPQDWTPPSRCLRSRGGAQPHRPTELMPKEGRRDNGAAPVQALEDSNAKAAIDHQHMTEEMEFKRLGMVVAGIGAMRTA